MGKWEASNSPFTHWCVTKNGTVCINCKDETQATRYALALNIVDAGVDLGDAVVFMQEAKAIRDYCEKYHAQPLIEDALYTKLYKEMVHPFLQRIANAVEGDTTKEDV